MLCSSYNLIFESFYEDFQRWSNVIPGAVKDGSKEDPNMEVLNSKVKRLEIDNLHLRTQTESLKNSNAKVWY